MRGDMFAFAWILGKVVSDVKRIQTASGTPMVGFSIITANSRRTQNENMYVDVNVCGERADVCARYLRKGEMVLVYGNLGVFKYTTADGTVRMAPNVSARSVEFIDIRPRFQDEDQGNFIQPAPPAIERDAPGKPGEFLQGRES